MRTFYLLLIVTAMLSCEQAQRKRPVSILEEQKMIAILVDAQLVEASIQLRVVNGENVTAISHAQYEVIFIDHGVTKSEFDSSYAWYTEDHVLLESIYDKVLEQLNELGTEIAHFPDDTATVSMRADTLHKRFPQSPLQK